MDLGSVAVVVGCHLALFVGERQVDQCSLLVKIILVMRIKVLVSVWSCFCKHICLSGSTTMQDVKEPNVTLGQWGSFPWPAFSTFHSAVLIYALKERY